MNKHTRVSNQNDLRTEYEDDFPSFEGPCPHCGELVGSSDETDAPKPRIFHYAPDRSYAATDSRPICPHCGEPISRRTPAGTGLLAGDFTASTDEEKRRGSEWSTAHDPAESAPSWWWNDDRSFELVRRF